MAHRRIGWLLALLPWLVRAQAAPVPSLIREPYLQKVEPTQALVAFRLSTDCVAQVDYGVGDEHRLATSRDSGRIHAVSLTGLAPGTSYRYAIRACGLQSADHALRTAPAPGSRSAHFVAVGDLGTGGGDQRAIAERMRTRQPELFLALGDLAYASGTEAEFQAHFFQPLAPLLSEVPLFTAPGNHEYVTNEAQPYLDNLYLPSGNPQGTERYYAFDWGPVHFVALDSNCALGMASPAHCTAAAQRAWAETDLTASRLPWKVVFFHHPPWSSGTHGSQVTVRRQFGPIFERAGVDLVLSGHDHDYERTRPMRGDVEARPGERGIPYLVVGGGGADLRRFPGATPTWSARRDDTRHAFLEVVVQEGTLTAWAMTPTGEMLDGFVLNKPLPPGPAPSGPTRGVLPSHPIPRRGFQETQGPEGLPAHQRLSTRPGECDGPSPPWP
ncbi:metallophosphoesterase [Corallococcus sp. H22C18031201]|nr:metallophosphoesterase [Corallococcus sp. H22C18031201]